MMWGFSVVFNPEMHQTSTTIARVGRGDAGTYAVLKR